MRRRKSTTVEINLQDPEYYINRESSWLEFNARVLHEAIDPRTPLLERLKFLAIFSSNLDEYFMVRVAVLKERVENGVKDLTPDGRTPQEQITLISEKLRPLVVKQHRHFEQALRPQLAAQGVYILDYIDLSQEQRAYLQNYFNEQIFPVLTPLAIDAPSQPFPFISNLSVSLVVVLKNSETGKESFARVKVPLENFDRFVPLPIETQNSPTEIAKSRATVWAGVPLEQVIAHNLDTLFPGMNIQEYYPFRITRDADLDLREDDADDLSLAIEEELRNRRFGGVVRMEYHAAMPDHIRDLLMQKMEIGLIDAYAIEGLLCLRDLMSLMSLPLPELKDSPWTPVVPPLLKTVNDLELDEAATEPEENFFAAIRQQDILVHHPYHSFAQSVQRFIEEAALDPNVLAMKMTLYRTSGDSPIVKALITAAEKGKQVAAIVELKARFDEENNIIWARRLEDVGVHVVYGLVKLKTHTKIVLIVRREEGRIRRYVHIGTGNYNPKTARLYTDLGLFSCREELGADLTDLFNFLTGYSQQRSYRKLLVAPITLRDRMLDLIHRETEIARNGSEGRIVAKMNALVDPQIIYALYEASQAGVQIDLIIRGICCLRPGVKDVSETIRVISIVGRFLEHARIFYFNNNGASEVLIGSADWMPRNLDRRVEAVVPIKDPKLAQDLQEMLGIMLADNRNAWELQSDGRYVQRHPAADQPEQSSQKTFMDMAQGS